MALVFCFNEILEKVKMQGVQQFSAFSIVTERTQLNAARAQFLEKLRPISFEELADFLRSSCLNFKKFGQKIVQKPRKMIYHKKIRILT